LLEVALDIHQILMLKNKIYNYFFNEILKNFAIILLTFSAIAWVVRAVNFLDLMVEDGYGSSIYFQYSILSIVNILIRFIPLAFLLSLTISIIKFERQKELQILWTIGLSKINIVNIFLRIGFFITFAQLILSIFINPYLLNKSRFIVSDGKTLDINTILRSNDFSDSFKNITFYIDEKNNQNELINIFIKDESGKLNASIEDSEQKKDSTIIAKKGFVVDEKLILYNGMIQTLNKKNEIKNIFFETTELSLGGLSTRTIKQPKIQETSSYSLIGCIFDLKKNVKIDNCSSDYKNEAIQNISRRIGTPLYIILISIITSFLLIYKKERTYNFLKKYYLFFVSFIILIFSEILLKYTGKNLSFASFYFFMPIVLSVFFYIYLLKKIMSEKITK